ncbi:DUF4247 domain-containing protein [Metabacillus fastidiosus]|uniref:DUF4247 domain-containing protein n=1 Tax=Metabacillus fastidiosus TaxID=1458 RepID=UPI003D2697A8
MGRRLPKNFLGKFKYGSHFHEIDVKAGVRMKKPLLFIIVGVMFLLTACGSGTQGSLFKDGIAEFINNNYEFQDVVASQTNKDNFSEVFIAENKSIDEVANELQQHQSPDEVSNKNNNKQVLVYPDLFVILTADENNNENILIEVADYQFVRDNFSPDFFDGLLVLWILDEILDVDDWGKKRKNKCYQNNDDCYQGYGSSGGSYKWSKGTPSVRGGTSSVRGGGPGTGK